MRMIDKYSVEHRKPFIQRLRHTANVILNNMNMRWVKPLDCGVQSLFVVGCGHSGTTLVTSRLARAPSVYSPSWETGLFLPIHGLYAASTSYKVLANTALSNGKSILVEKTPKHVHCARRILAVLPTARFIVVTRNPLDTCASLYRRFPDLPYCIERWQIDNSAALSLFKHDNQCFHLRYEDITHDPERSFGDLFRFAGVEWSTDFLSPGRTPFDDFPHSGNMAKRAAEVAEPILPRVNTWPETLNVRQAKQILQRTMPLAAKLGYITAPHELSRK